MTQAATERDIKDKRRLFADGASLRIAVRMHEAVRRGQTVTPDQWRRWWYDEAKVAKAAGLYAFSTYVGDIRTGLIGMADERGWIRNVPVGSAT